MTARAARAAHKLNRRHLLTALGAGGALAYLGPGARPLHAQTTAARYFVGVYMPHGMAREYWVPRAGFDISYENSSLAPFDDANTFGKSYADQLLVVEGLDVKAGIDGGTTGHDASRALFTGSSQHGKNASIDQFLALEHGLGRETPLASLVLGVGNSAPDLGQCISYAKGGAAVPKLIDPSRTFAQAFAQLVVGDDPAALERVARERRLGKSLLDYWNADLKRLSARAPESERDKLEQHAAALRELEQRLDPQLNGCSPPSAPDASTYPELLAYGGGEPYFDTITNLQIDLLAQALGCGVTHVATLFLADLSRTHLDPQLPDDVHIDVAHRYTSGGRAGGGDPASWLPLARQNRYAHGKVARLLQRLDENGILDQTVLIALSDMGDPNRHSSRQIPALLAGGWGGHLKGGRHLDLGAAGTPHNRVLVAAQRAFDVDSDTFGEDEDLAVTTGALDLA
ncbi:MAG TPA: DUF1552 domain-containing protein [Polyangiaceae bacterium]|nr:DUF1552 domain-containing protein [Polyangiaceae bacterium]